MRLFAWIFPRNIGKESIPFTRKRRWLARKQLAGAARWVF